MRCIALIALLLVLVPHALMADMLHMKDGNSYAGSWIVKYEGGMIYAKKGDPEKKTLSEKDFPIPITGVSGFRLETWTDKGYIEYERGARLEMLNGKIFNRVTVGEAERDENGVFGFNIAAPPNPGEQWSETHFVKAESIKLLDFDRCAPSPILFFNREDTRYEHKLGSMHFMITAEELKEIDARSLEDKKQIPGYSIVAEKTRKGQWPEAADYDWDRYGDAGSPDEVIRVNSDGEVVRTTKAGAAMGKAMEFLITFSIAVVSLTLFNGLMILFVCKTNKVPGVGVKESFTASFWMAVIPNLAFMLLKLLPGFVGITLGILAHGFLSRAILMGALEVLEGTAWTIQTTCSVFTLLLFFWLYTSGLQAMADAFYGS